MPCIIILKVQLINMSIDLIETEETALLTHYIDYFFKHKNYRHTFAVIDFSKTMCFKKRTK